MDRQDKRVTLTVKLTVGKDDDLIEWLASLPKGRRQAAIKGVLRGALDCDHQEVSATEQLAQIKEDTTWLRAALSEMPTWMERLLAGVADGPAAQVSSNGKAARIGQLSNDDVARREKRIAKAAW